MLSQVPPAGWPDTVRVKEVQTADPNSRAAAPRGARGRVENVTRQVSRVQSAFRQQAQGFGEPGLTLGSQHLLQWIVESLPLAPQMRTLDVAAGTGHVSRVVAPRVRSVTAVDVTPAMLHEARAASAAARLGNLRLVQADAGRLPFADGRFDLVMCRLALHHFADPVVEVAEMARVTRRSGTLAIIDLLSPDDAELADRYNRFERMRDPSHTRALTGAELRDLLEAVGRPVGNWSVREVDVDLGPWFDLTRSPVSTRKTISEALQREHDGGPATGMRPRQRRGRLSFVQTWALAQSGPGDRPPPA